jgi:DNA processing protein
MLEAREVLFGLHELEGIGWHTIKRIMEHGCWEACLRGDREMLMRIGVDEGRSRIIAGTLSEAFVDRRKQVYEKKEIGFLTYLDEHYPALLRETPWPPWVLYYAGDLRLLNGPSIAIVGTRTPTVYGRRTADMLAERLSGAGFSIVSGLARGIDSIAHRAAMRGPGGTIAVLGTPLDRVYPPENRELFRQLAESGLILTEYPLSTKPHPGLFPRRNRLIAGLGWGTVVVEGGESSGTLITADYALEASRDVFAVPGPITSPKSAGPHRLIRQGAILVTCAEDIAAEYAHRLDCSEIHMMKTPHVEEESLSGEELTVLSRIGDDPVSVDELMVRTKFTFGHLHSVLLSLTMKNKIEQLPGFSYIRKS